MPSLLDLIEANIIIPGRNNISVSYKGTTYTASLEKDGAISYQGAPQPPLHTAPAGPAPWKSQSE